MLFADFVPSPSDLGSLMIGLVFILLFFERLTSAVRFFWPAKHVENGNNTAIKNDYATKADIVRLEGRIGELTKDYKDLLKSSFDRYEAFTQMVANLRVGQEALHRELCDEMAKAIAIISDKIDRAENRAMNGHKATQR